MFFARELDQDGKALREYRSKDVDRVRGRRLMWIRRPSPGAVNVVLGHYTNAARTEETVYVGRIGD